MLFEEVHGKLDALHYVEYYAKFGTQHLQSPAHDLKFIAKYDLDIKVLAGLTLAGILLAIWLLITNMLCPSKQD